MAFIDVLEQFRNYLKGILDSSNERENEAETIDNIRKGINFCHLYRFPGTQCKFHGSDHRCHVDLPFNGTDHGYRLRGRNQRL